MQADESPQSIIVLKLLEDTRKYTFDLSLNDSWLRSVFFRSRFNERFENNSTLLLAKSLSEDGQSFPAKNNYGRNFSTGSTTVLSLKNS